MTTSKTHVLAALLVCPAFCAHAAVSPEEARQLGTTLTPWGAEVAGNKEGTIPAYTGPVKPPAGWSKDKPGQRPDPFAGEKPLVSITAKNMAEHADKLTEGMQAMLKAYPSFRIDVYPSHRAVGFPASFNENSIKNATGCKSVSDGLAIQGCVGGLPFPIPKSGIEAIWNAQLRYVGYVYEQNTENWYVDAAGRATFASANMGRQIFHYYAPGGVPISPEFKSKWWTARYNYIAPARTAGESVLVSDPLDYVNDKRVSHQYIPGQRRVKLAPDLAYDSPIPNSGGLATMDQTPIFGGSPDRFDFKLLGKKEIYLPYNTYKLGAGGDATSCSPKAFLTPKHWNPDCVRFELHRAWVVEATLKPGKRHIYARMTFYLDEDQSQAFLKDSYDAAGQLYRMGYTFSAPQYEAPAPLGDVFGNVDLQSQGWMVYNWDVPGSKGIYQIPAPSASYFTPESLAGGIR